jgi:cysteine sulfinate desulfinase/cysteine desulfurase-like protein
MNVPAEWLQGAIRFSLSGLNTQKDIDYVNEKLPLIVQRLRGLSALGKLADREAEPNQNRANGGRQWA